MGVAGGLDGGGIDFPGFQERQDFAEGAGGQRGAAIGQVDGVGAGGISRGEAEGDEGRDGGGVGFGIEDDIDGGILGGEGQGMPGGAEVFLGAKAGGSGAAGDFVLPAVEVGFGGQAEFFADLVEGEV